MAAAALTKFLPALLALQFLGVRQGRSRYALTLVASLAAMLAWPLITSGPAQFLDSTFGYQLIQRGGGIQFSIWTYLPHVAIVARPVLAAALVLLALSPMVRPPVQDARSTPLSPPRSSSARSYSWATGSTATSPGSIRSSSSRSSKPGRTTKRPARQRPLPSASPSPACDYGSGANRRPGRTQPAGLRQHRDALLDAARRYVTEVASQHYPDEAHSYA